MAALSLHDGLARHIRTRDVSFRTRLLEMAADIPDVIALGRGDPDFHTPSHIVAAAHKALDENRHHYTAVAGLEELTVAIAAMLRQEHGLGYAPEEIIVTNGVEEAIMTCMASLLNPGDEVLMGSPRFTNYDKAINLCHGTVVSVPTCEADDFVMQAEDVEARISDRTRMLVLVSPDNPTGAVTPPDTVRALARLVRRHNLILVSDEIYSRILFDGARHLSPASLPDMHERTITLNGFSKAYAMTGWRLGYMAGPAAYIRQVLEVRHTLSISASTIAQYAALAALAQPRGPWWDPIQAELEERRACVLSTLDDLGFTYGFPGGGYFLFPNITSLGFPAARFCEMLLQEGRVLVFPGSQEGMELEGEYIRMSILQPLSQLEEAMRRLRRTVDSLP
jgi:aminotransferase